MAGRKTKLTPERQQTILRCVRAGLSKKAAAQAAGISEHTLYNWIVRGEKDTQGQFFEFLGSLQSVESDFELSNFDIIQRSSTEERRTVRQTVTYKSGQVVNGKLVDGQVMHAKIVTVIRPPTARGAMRFLARRFPKEWGRKKRGEVREKSTEVVLCLPDNGRMRPMGEGKTAQLPKGTEMAKKRCETANWIGDRKQANVCARVENEGVTGAPTMAGRKTKFTPERREKILRCVRVGMSNRATAQAAGISEKTLYNWIESGKKDTRGPFFEFLESFQLAEAHLQSSNLKLIQRSSTEKTETVRETVKYKGGRVEHGRLVGGKVISTDVVTVIRPPTPRGAMWLLERRYPAEFGPP